MPAVYMWVPNSELKVSLMYVEGIILLCICLCCW